MKTFLVSIVFIISSFMMPYGASAAASKTTVKDVEQHLMCMCEDKCGKMLKNCTCKFSDDERNAISLKLRDGLTKDDILAFYIDKYGDKVLAAPTKKGFNLIAWVTPFALLFLGALGVRWIVTSWVKKGDDIRASVVEKKAERGQEKTGKYTEQLKKELNDFDC